jgi:hypothetical protein
MSVAARKFACPLNAGEANFEFDDKNRIVSALANLQAGAVQEVRRMSMPAHVHRSMTMLEWDRASGPSMVGRGVPSRPPFRGRWK